MKFEQISEEKRICHLNILLCQKIQFERGMKNKENYWKNLIKSYDYSASSSPPAEDSATVSTGAAAAASFCCALTFLS